MQRSTRIDYDVIGDRYDMQPHRGKSVDPELVSFIAERGRTRERRLLDIGCGTGSQLIANLSIAPSAR